MRSPTEYLDLRGGRFIYVGVITALSFQDSQSCRSLSEFTVG